jgi:hypothetical protein
MKTIYLAVPYSSKGLFGRLVMWFRYRSVTVTAAALMKAGHNVFSPITHSHIISRIGKLPPLDHEFWLRMDKWYVLRCDVVYVLLLTGWQDSVGVRREIRWALEKDKNVFGITAGGDIISMITEVP